MAVDPYREIKNLEDRIIQLKIVDSNPYAPNLTSGMSITTELPKVDILEKKLATKNAEIEYLTKRLDFVESFIVALHDSVLSLAEASRIKKRVCKNPADPNGPDDD
jgi:hypothetical protein